MLKMWKGFVGFQVSYLSLLHNYIKLILNNLFCFYILQCKRRTDFKIFNLWFVCVCVCEYDIICVTVCGISIEYFLPFYQYDLFHSTINVHNFALFLPKSIAIPQIGIWQTWFRYNFKQQYKYWFNNMLRNILGAISNSVICLHKRMFLFFCQDVGKIPPCGRIRTDAWCNKECDKEFSLFFHLKA